MSKVCEICGKGPVAGRNVSHSQRVTNRWFRPQHPEGHHHDCQICPQGQRSAPRMKAGVRHPRVTPSRNIPYGK